MVPSPPHTRTRFAPDFTVSRMAFVMASASVSRMSNAAADSSALRAASAEPALLLRNAMTGVSLDRVVPAVVVAGLAIPSIKTGSPALANVPVETVNAGVLGRGPESGQSRAVRRLPQLLERALANLADSLASHAHERADFLESHRLGPFFQAVVQVQDLPLARSEVGARSEEHTSELHSPC